MTTTISTSQPKLIIAYLEPQQAGTKSFIVKEITKAQFYLPSGAIEIYSGHAPLMGTLAKSRIIITNLNNTVEEYSVFLGTVTVSTLKNSNTYISVSANSMTPLKKQEQS